MKNGLLGEVTYSSISSFLYIRGDLNLGSSCGSSHFLHESRQRVVVDIVYSESVTGRQLGLKILRHIVSCFTLEKTSTDRKRARGARIPI